MLQVQISNEKFLSSMVKAKKYFATSNTYNAATNMRRKFRNKEAMKTNTEKRENHYKQKRIFSQASRWCDKTMPFALMQVFLQISKNKTDDFCVM